MGTERDVKQGGDQAVKQGDDVLAGPRGSSAAALETSHKAQVESMGLVPQSEAPHGQDAPVPERITEVPEDSGAKQAVQAAPSAAATQGQDAKQDRNELNQAPQTQTGR